MVSMALNKKRKYFSYMISILMVALLISGTAVPVYAGAEDQLDQWDVRYDPDVTYGSNYKLLDIAYGNEQFIAVGESGTVSAPVLTSTDGKTWITQNSGVSGARGLKAVAFGGGQFAAVTKGRMILTWDGYSNKAWPVRSKYSSAAGNDLLTVAYGNNTFVAAGASGNTWTSTDGAIWTKNTVGSSSDIIKGIICGKSIFVMVGNEGKIWTSPDGKTWTPQISGTTNALNAISFGNDGFLAVGQSGTILTSMDGVQWENHSIGGSAANLNDVAFGSGIFTAVGSGGAVLTSTDGKNWTPQNTGLTGELSGVAYGNYTFCIVGGSKIFQSKNLGPVVSGIDPADGLETGGTEVTITGSNLSGATAVYFGNVKSDLYTINSDTSITAVAPPGIGSVQVKVWGAEGVSNSVSNNLFTYIPLAPVITGQPPCLVVDAGHTATFMAEALGEAPLAYQWKKDGVTLSNGGNISGADGTTLTVSNARNADEGSYTCYISNKNGNATSNAAPLTVIEKGEPPAGNWSNYISEPALSGSAYSIDSAEELAWLAREINLGHNLSTYTFSVTSDIDLSIHYWTPIGAVYARPFASCFNGGGHTITGMAVGSESNPSPYEYNGLFGVSGTFAQIKDIKIADASVFASSGTAAGELVGYNKGTIDNCSAAGAVKGGDGAYLGGLVGSSSGTISNSNAKCTVTGGDGSTSGGFAGDSMSSILNCYATGNVSGGGPTADFESWIGGFIGFSGYNAPINNCYASGNVTGGTGAAVGGFMGRNTYANLTSIYWNRDDVQMVGGLVRESNLGVGSGVDTTFGADMKVSSFAGILNGGIGSLPAGPEYLSWISDRCNNNGGYPIFITDMTPPQISPATISFMLNGSNDASAEIIWNSAQSVTGVAIGAGSLTPDDDYTVSGNRITIKKEFISSLYMVENDTQVFQIGFDLGDSVPLTVKAGKLSSDASLSDLKVGGSSIAGFAADKYSYDIQLPYGTQPGSSAANVAAVPTDPKAHVTITQAFTLPGNAVVDVTAEDGAAKQSYTIHFTLGANPNGNGGNGGGSSGGSTSKAGPADYNASILGDGRTQNSLPLAVNAGMGSAALDLRTLTSSLFSSGKETVVKVPSIPGVNSYTVEIPTASLADSQGESILTFSAALGSLTVSGDMLKGIPGSEGKAVGITIAQGNKTELPEEAKAAIGDRPLIQLSLTIDKKQTEWNNPETPVTISIPYTPSESELANPESIVVWYIDGSGNLVSVPNGHYDPATGTVIFSITHFSYYVVGCNQVNFSDIPENSWYSKAVRFIAAREITTGMGNGCYQPQATLTRGSFLVMMMRAYGIEPDTAPKDNFTDAGSKYYTNYLSAAKRLGISNGIGGNLFAPDKEITRQEMFTLQYNMLKKINRLPAGDSGKQLTDFSDAGQVASWAEDAAAFLAEAGVISGNGGIISPKGTVTRAEMAQTLYNLLSK